jgi:hypothetical protein
VRRDTPQSKSALRGIWTAIFFAAISILVSHASDDFWSDDFVSRGFRWFFQNYGVYAGIAGLILFAAVVTDRLSKGERIKADPGLVLSILGLIVSILGLLPDSIRNQWYQSIIGAAH